MRGQAEPHPRREPAQSVVEPLKPECDKRTLGRGLDHWLHTKIYITGLYMYLPDVTHPSPTTHIDHPYARTPKSPAPHTRNATMHPWTRAATTVGCIPTWEQRHSTAPPPRPTWQPSAT
ncbi:hypothetical protein Ahu01nite_029640 [Winogradskya humida]|uniref:Uncharacterized protein n=1 Tax=Winogradskya humida TaxID=113566 RepID=A0ABQ3ZMQ2_9ACTN|nr:hypothetical protein Ahu01nite_029640 [Actinoplanes humidus]